MGKQMNKNNNKKQKILKIGTGGNWEKNGKKKDIKLQEKLKPTQEEDKKEEERPTMNDKSAIQYENNTREMSIETNAKDTDREVVDI